MSIYPTQSRSIDPYSEYNSNVINSLTRMLTKGVNCIDSLNSIDIKTIPNSTYTLNLTTGQCYKDDVIIQITQNMTIDLTNSLFYPSGSVPFNEAGNYYILLSYNYVKAKPAPQASIRILKPSQLTQFSTSSYILLKVVNILFNGTIFYINALYNSDPNTPANKRTYSQVFTGAEDTLPTWTSTDESRIIYVRDQDEIYFGTSAGWESSSAVRSNIDTTLCTVGQLIYVGSDGLAHPAIATSLSTFSDGVCTQVGTKSSGNGKVRLCGEVYTVPIQTGITVNIGDKLYLSASQAGSVTNYISEPYAQYVGSCISVSSGSCTVWFTPSVSGLSGSETTDDSTEIYKNLLLDSTFNRLFTDAFINTNYVNLSSTTASINTTTYSMNGTNGQVFVSKSLTDPGYDGTCITSCQLSAEMSNISNVSWYVTNDGTNFENIISLDQIHTFSTVSLPFSSGQILTPGEWVKGLSSGKEGVLCGQTANAVLLCNETGSSNWINGETLQGQTSGRIVYTSGNAVHRSSCKDLRVKAVWTGNSSIYDYGILYDYDTLIDETDISDSKNIETLYSDVYEVPSLNNDGLRLYPFMDSTAFHTLNLISRTSTLSRAIAKVDNTFGFGQFSQGNSTPSVSSHYRNYLVYNTSIPLSITGLTGGYVGQEITIVHAGGGAVTITNGSYIHLAGGSDFILGIYDTITLIFVSNSIGWVEKCRSNN